MRIPFAAAAVAALCAATLTPAAPAMAQSQGTAHGHSPSAASQPAGEARLGPIAVSGAWARAAAAPGGASAAYLTITIDAGRDRLISAESDASARVELHTHEVDSAGVARMREIPAIPVAADAPAELKPRGLHVMLMGLQKPLAVGDSIDLTLVFETAGRLSLTVPVRTGPAMQH